MAVYGGRKIQKKIGFDNTAFVVRSYIFITLHYIFFWPEKDFCMKAERANFICMKSKTGHSYE